MKHTLLNFNKIIAGLFISGFLTFTAVSATAKPFKKTAVSVSIAPQVKYLGVDENGASLIEVSFETADPVKFEVSLTDINNESVFYRSFETSKFYKVFKLVSNGNTPTELEDLTLAIKLLPGGEAHYYKVNSDVELVNNISVTKN